MHALVLAATMHGQRIAGTAIALAASRKIATLAHGPDRGYVAAAPVSDQTISSNGRVDLRAQSPIDTPTFVNVPVQIEVDGRLDRTVLVGFRVQRYVETAVAAHDIVPGTVLTQSDLAMARVPYTGVAGNGTAILMGRRVRESYVKGMPVTIAQTQVNQIVAPGSTVVFIVRDGPVLVTADAIARTGGGLGEQVTVYSNATRKQLTGTVTAPGTVELDISGGAL